MPAHRLIHPIRLAQALSIVALCAVLAAGAFADRGGSKSSDRNSASIGAARQSGGSGGDHGYRAGPSPGRTESPRGGTMNQPGGGAGSYGSRSEQHSPAVSQPGGIGSRGDRRGGEVNQPAGATNPGRSHGGAIDQPARPGSASNGRGDQHSATPYRPTSPGSTYGDRGNAGGRPDTRNHRPIEISRPAPVAPARPAVPTRPQVRTPERGRDTSQYRPQGYVPPVHRGGFYYYSSRPNLRPLHYGYWVFDHHDPRFCRRSVYFHFGLFPYVQVARVHITPYITLTYYSTPVIIEGGYYLARRTTAALDNALADIRSAWLDGRLDLIKDHVRTDQQIAVLLDGKYDYSLDPDDYVQMTSDALEDIQTVSFNWQTVRERTDSAYTAFGKHVYRDSSGTEQTVYVSYTLRRIGGSNYIEEVGSSTSPLS